MKEKIQNINTRLTKNKKMDIKDTILIVGSPRSGTTLLMNIISTLPSYTYIFEPLNPIWFPESFKIGFQSRSYIQKDKNWEAGKDYLNKIFTAQIANLPIKDNPISDLLHGFSIKKIMRHLYGNKIVIKSTNMNRMLPWIVKNFQLRATFFIIRHPCATIASQIKSEDNPERKLSVIEGLKQTYGNKYINVQKQLYGKIDNSILYAAGFNSQILKKYSAQGKLNQDEKKNLAIRLGESDDRSLENTIIKSCINDQSTPYMFTAITNTDSSA